MAKVRWLQLKPGESATIRGVGIFQNKLINVGARCSVDFGGGNIEGLEVVGQSVVITKSVPFTPKAPGEGGQAPPPFDDVRIPLSSVAAYGCVNEKPAQGQGQQQGQKDNQRR